MEQGADKTEVLNIMNNKKLSTDFRHNEYQNVRSLKKTKKDR